ncbi:ABC transporter permease [Carnobacterium gallinarum]|uniref:ABC transporter permease n=1 Tax=Carnobacterium gallinarum TaxID=2749 RepID=UPI00054E43CA|nr:ABC transporter permease [Carnobacterium gallinarum]
MMNKQNPQRRLFFSMMVLLLSLWMYYKASINLVDLKEYSETISIYSSTATIDETKIQKILQNNKTFSDSVDLVIWNEFEGESVTNPRLFRNETTGILIASGQINLLFGEDVKLMEMDKEGGVISKGLAEKLFGDTRVVGKEFMYQQKTYSVRQVLTNVKENLVVIRPQINSDKRLNTITAMKPNSVISPNTLKSKLSNRYELNGELTEFNLLTGLLTLYLYIPLIYVTFDMLRLGNVIIEDFDYTKQEYLPMQGLLKVFLWALVIGVWSYFLNRNNSISSDYIPSQWSDFDFFMRLGSEKIEALKDFVRMPKRYFEMCYLNYTRQVLIYNFLAIQFLKWSFKLQRSVQKKTAIKLIK